MSGKVSTAIQAATGSDCNSSSSLFRWRREAVVAPVGDRGRAPGATAVWSPASGPWGRPGFPTGASERVGARRLVLGMKLEIVVVPVSDAGLTGDHHPSSGC